MQSKNLILKCFTDLLWELLPVTIYQTDHVEGKVCVVLTGDHIHFGDVKRVGLAQLTIMIVQGQLHICDSLFIQLDQSHVTDLALDLYTTRSVAHTVQAYAQRR